MVEEREDYVVKSMDMNSNTAIEIKEANFSWDKEKGGLVLRDLNMKVEKGKFVAIVGSVGASKSSLISSLLGDTEKVSGSIEVNGSISYSSQQAWIQNATVRENVLFGKDYNSEFYKNAIRSCQLESDFELLPAGNIKNQTKFFKIN